MAWKKIIVSGSQAELNQITVDNTVTANSFAGGGASITGVVHNAGEIASQISGSLGANATLIRSLTASGISGSFDALSGSIATRFDGLTTNYLELENIPSGIISSSAQIDSNLFNIDGLISGSSQVVSSLVNQEINLGTAAITASRFTGDGSALTNITVDQNATVASTFTNQTSVAVNHNFDTKNVIVQVYDSNDQVIIPASITSTTVNQSTITFDGSTSGTVVIARGGHIVSGSVNSLDGQEGSYYLNYNNFTNIPSGIVSSSAQIDSLFNIDGLLSGSAEGDSQGQIKLNGTNVNINELGTNDSPTFVDLTLTGDLTVQGTTTSIQTENLLVEDKFILINSGSGAADGGLVVNGAGAALGWDNSEGRWSLDSAGALANQTTISTDAFVAGVVDIDAGHVDISAYQKNGNIKVDSGTIYIYA